MRRLRDVLEPAEQADLCEVVVRTNSTARDIFEVIQAPVTATLTVGLRPETRWVRV